MSCRSPPGFGATRTGGIDRNKPRIRAAPHGFTVAGHAVKAATPTGLARYPSRQAAYDLRKLCGNGLAVKPGRTRRCQIPGDAARTIAAVLALGGDQVLAPILAGVGSPRRGRKPSRWTRIDRDYETSVSACRPSSTIWARLSQPPHRKHLVDRRNASS